MENVLYFRYYRVLSKALLAFSVPGNQPSMTAHYKPHCEPRVKCHVSLPLTLTANHCEANLTLALTLASRHYLR